MSSKAALPDTPKNKSSADEHEHGRLGFFLCWAVVFADIGTSVYYTPGILYGQVGNLAGFFVFLTMAVFVLLTLKYSEVTYRYPEGGGVVTVAAKALHPWMGALGGMFILVDYFLTAAISSLSGLIYFSVVIPRIGPAVLPITLVMLTLLGVLNWWGVSESATVSAVGALVAFFSDIAILIVVFASVPLPELLHLIPQMFEGQHLTGWALLTGFSGAFLAFSGLESISQLSPVMKTPRKRTGRLALLLVVLTIGITSPLLTLLSTTLLDASKSDPNQFISLLGGQYGGAILGGLVAISASALLIFASNTAIIGCYHVFLALSRMRFFPKFVERRSALRGTPHFSIALATGIPILILILAQFASTFIGVNTLGVLGDLYAFGLLGAFSLTCIGLDVVRTRERNERRAEADSRLATSQKARSRLAKLINPITPISTVMYILGIITTGLVVLAWSTNLYNKLYATAFGGTITIVGLGIAYWTQRSQIRRGLRMVFPRTEIRTAIKDSILAILPSNVEEQRTIAHAACAAARHGEGGREDEVVFFYRGRIVPASRPKLMEVYDPYLLDEDAKLAFAEAESAARETGISKKIYVYQTEAPSVVLDLWQILQPRDTVLADEDSELAHELAPDRVRHTPTQAGLVTHYLKNWQPTPAIDH
ncbi:MAG TPA: APC family permease [Ktedonobacterales bacterium]|jgi:amino acid transporter